MLGRPTGSRTRSVDIDLLPLVAPARWSLPLDAEKLTWAAAALGAPALFYFGSQWTDVHP